MSTHKKHGFTLVELLVVIAIIGMLVGILLPAVQAARDAGRRTQNTNNLKNIGLALMSYNESQSELPALRYIRPEGNPPRHMRQYPETNSSVSWAFELLPYMEQGNIYDRFDKTRPVGDASNQLAMGSLIPVYANPRQGEARNNCPLPGGISGGRGTCIDYAANRGLFTTGSPTDPERFTMDFQKHAQYVGPFVHNQAVTTAHVKDGLSKTIAIGDKWMNPTTPTANGFQAADQIGRAGGLAGASSASMMRGPIVRITNSGVEAQEPGGLFPTSSDVSTNKLGGAGGGLVAVTFLDGHVKSIEYSTIDPNAYAAQCTINGGEIVLDDGS